MSYLLGVMDFTMYSFRDSFAPYRLNRSVIWAIIAQPLQNGTIPWWEKKETTALNWCGEGESVATITLSILTQRKKKKDIYRTPNYMDKIVGSMRMPRLFFSSFFHSIAQWNCDFQFNFSFCLPAIIWGFVPAPNLLWYRSNVPNSFNLCSAHVDISDRNTHAEQLNNRMKYNAEVSNTEIFPCRTQTDQMAHTHSERRETETEERSRFQPKTNRNIVVCH